MSGATILLVEDNPITLKMLRVTLELEGYSVLHCLDGKAALELVAARRPQLLLLDFMLPDTDGLRLLAAVRGHLAVPDLPAVLLTGMVSRLEDLRAQAGPFTQVVAKPVEPSHLVDVVRAQLAPAAQAGGRHILVVDDEPLNVKLAAFRLKSAGYQVDTAAGGAEALQRARRRRPDAILSDVMMPSMDGFMFCREVRRDEALATVPIVLISAAYVDEADRELSRQVGANALVVRTPDLHDAMGALEASLRGTGPPSVATAGDVSALHQERLLVQLERQATRNESLLRQAAIQATALSIIRGLSEVLSQPAEVPLILGDVLVHCLDAAGLSTGLLYLVEGSASFRLQAQFGIPAERRADAETFFGHAALLQRVLSSSEPAALSASLARDEEESDFIARLGYASALVLPFVVLGETFGALVLASDSHDLAEASWIGFARSLSLQFGQTVALGQSVKRLAVSESRYRALMEHANDAIHLLDSGGVILEANRRSEVLLGLPREVVIGRHISEFTLSLAGAPDNLARFGEVVAAGGGQLDHVPLRRGDGSSVEVDFSMSLTEVDGRTTVLSIGRDVTERRRAEADIRERMELSAFEAAIGAALVGNEPQPAALRQCAEVMVRDLHAALARIWTLDESGQVLELQASAGVDHDGDEARIALGEGHIGIIAAGRKARTTNDVLDDPSLPDREWARREGLVAFAGYPLVVGEGLVGVLAVFARHPLSPAALAALASVANQVALGIERTRAETRLRDAQQKLQHVVASSPAVLYSLAVDGATLVHRWVSPNVRRFTGYEQHEVTADWWPQHLHPEDRDWVLAQSADLLSEGSAVREYRFRHKDGSYRWIRDEQVLITQDGLPREVIGSWADVTARKEAEDRLHESERQYRLLFDSNPFPMAVVEQESLAFLAVNEAAVRAYGYSLDEFPSMSLHDIRVPEEAAVLRTDYDPKAAEGGRGAHLPTTRRHRKKDGTVIDVEVERSPIEFRGRPAWLILAVDVTEKTTLAAQLVKAQKMEAIGQLAGGVAHDFNNLLGVITGYNDLLMRQLPPDSTEHKRGMEIKGAAQRAAALTRQLLAFSRRQVLQPKVMDLNRSVAEVEKMLHRLIRENVQIVTLGNTSLGKVRADAGQIEQVIMNLAINARDAMPDGGRLTIETANVDLDEAYERSHPGARGGPHVALTVADTGHGMDAHTLSRIFEPFFTTKEEGKGTGLGLATVYGIVKQSGGSVDVLSQPNRGTTFTVYLPRVEEPADVAPAARTETLPGGRETILLVEDAEALRLLVRELLENAGYTVLDADAPDKALALVQATTGPIDLVLTDMVMPRMSGRELARQIAALKPRASVVFMSGYSDQAIGDLGNLDPETVFLQKPFATDVLLRTVRRALDAGAPRP